MYYSLVMNMLKMGIYFYKSIFYIAPIMTF